MWVLEMQSNTIKRVREIQQSEPKRAPGGQKGNQNAVRHGVYSIHAGSDFDTELQREQIIRDLGGKFDLYECRVCGDCREYPRAQLHYRRKCGPGACLACGAKKFAGWRRALQAVPPLSQLKLSVIDRYLATSFSRISRAG